jgi:GT2 family glycosyltransferase
MREGGRWPKISIVTPSFNQGPFLEETVRSVLLQGYPDLEYTVIDGASSDESVDVIKKYEPWLAFWVSETDRGQSHAINKGLARAAGEVMAWLNSDDFYLPGALAGAAERMGAGGGFVIGGVTFVDMHSRVVGLARPRPGSGGSVLKNGLVQGRRLWQPGMFWTRDVFRRTDPLAERLHYVMDTDFLLRAMAQGVDPLLCDTQWACFRLHKESKTAAHAARFSFDHARMYWQLSTRPGFRRLACWREASRHIGYGCRKRMVLSLERRKLARSCLWLAGSLLAFPSPPAIRANLGAFARGAKGVGAAGNFVDGIK